MGKNVLKAIFMSISMGDYLFMVLFFFIPSLIGSGQYWTPAPASGQNWLSWTVQVKIDLMPLLIARVHPPPPKKKSAHEVVWKFAAGSLALCNWEVGAGRLEPQVFWDLSRPATHIYVYSNLD
jgi:hypothetical protein